MGSPQTEDGYANEPDARASYLAFYSDGFGNKILHSISGPFSVDEFKAMLTAGEFARRHRFTNNTAPWHQALSFPCCLFDSPQGAVML